MSQDDLVSEKVDSPTPPVTMQRLSFGLIEASTRLSNDVSWTEAVNGFLAAGIDNAGTRRAYRRHLRRAGVLFEDRSPADISGVDLATYRQSVIDSGTSPSTQCQALSAIRSFLTWFGTLRGQVIPKPLLDAALRAPRATVQVPYTALTEREIERLLAAPASPRDHALLVVLLGAGLRVAEVSGLNIADLRQDDEGGMFVYIREGKGAKDRSVPVGEEVEAALCRYLAETGRFLGEDGPLFLQEDRGAACRSDGNRLSARSIGRIVKQRARAAGISAKRVTPHALRHTYAFRVLRAGGNVVGVGKLLGHANVATTQRYLAHLELRDLREMVPQLPGLTTAPSVGISSHGE